jgi:hypothetical protein
MILSQGEATSDRDPGDALRTAARGPGRLFRREHLLSFPERHAAAGRLSTAPHHRRDPAGRLAATAVRAGALHRARAVQQLDRERQRDLVLISPDFTFLRKASFYLYNAVVLLFVVATGYHDFQRLKTVIWWSGGGALLAQLLYLECLYAGLAKRATGTFNNPNQLAAAEQHPWRRSRPRRFNSRMKLDSRMA